MMTKELLLPTALFRHVWAVVLLMFLLLVVMMPFIHAQENVSSAAAPLFDVLPMEQVLQNMQTKLQQRDVSSSFSILPLHLQGVFWLDQGGYLTPDLPQRPKDRVGQNALVAFDGIDDSLLPAPLQDQQNGGTGGQHVLTIDHTGPAWPFFHTTTGTAIFNVQAAETSFYRWYFDESWENTQVYYYKPSLDGRYYPSAQVAGVDVNMTMHRQKGEEFCSADMLDLSSASTTTTAATTTTSSAEIAKCASWIRTTIVVDPADRSQQVAALPDYYVYQIVNGTGHAIEPFYSKFLEYSRDASIVVLEDFVNGDVQNNGMVGKGGRLASLIEAKGRVVEPDTQGVWDAGIQDHLVDAAMAGFCQQQEELILSGATLDDSSNNNTEALNMLYAKDLLEYIAGPDKFLLSRAAKCGGGDRNFAALGRIILGDYATVQELLTNNAPQVRGWYLGRAKLNPNRMPPHFLLAMSDSGTDTEEGRSGVHDILRDTMIETIILPAQQRLQEQDATRSVLKNHVDTLIDRLISEAQMGTSDEVNTTVAANVVGDFVTQWCLKAIFDLNVTPEATSLIKNLFLMPSLNIYGFWVEPFASQFSFEDGLKISAVFDSIVSIIEMSPLLKDYSPSESNSFQTKYDYAKELAAFFSGASLLGVQHFILNIFTHILPSDDYALLDPDDVHMLGSALLEAARFNPPVKNVNIILPQATTLRVSGADRMFPKGTSIMASILLSGFDANVFPDPITFDVERSNLKSNILTFATLGYDPQYSFDTGRRSCLGQHLVFQVGIDVLAAWLRRAGPGDGSSSSGGDSIGSGVRGEISSSACMAKFTALGFESDKFHLYHRYFREDSTFIYPAAGVYEGATAIEEYISFVSLRNPIFREKIISNVDISLKNVDEANGSCTFVVNSLVYYETDPDFYVESKFMVVASTKVKYQYHDDYIKEINLFYTDEFLKFVMARSQPRSEHICNVHAKCLNQTNDEQSMTHGECMERLKMLPTYTVDDEGLGYIDGNSYSCRALHSQLAEFDNHHCPHVAFAPTEDLNGAVKCQVSEHMLTSDFFDGEDMDEYRRYVEKLNTVQPNKANIDPALGFKILSLPPEENGVRSLVAGVIVPIVLFLGVYIGMQCAKPESILSSPESKRLWTIGFVWIVVLMSTFGLAALTIWGIGHRNPEWSEWWAGDGSSEFAVLGKQSTPSGTEVQSRLGDDAFFVYVGFIIWITTLIAGVGMEALVWMYFIRVWSVEREHYWRFAQFFFPLLAMTALGLALYQNYLSLPVMVFGLWKFGFPETLMYIYLGIFGRQGAIGRASDFLNGVGTAVHHGSAAFIIAMLTVGVVPPSRHLISPILILIMQHWVALIAYNSRALYSSIELVLDYYFQWSVLSNFQQLYHLHWTAALGGACMLFAHWMYLLAAILSLCVRPNGNDDNHSNVHTRGVELMTAPPKFKKKGRRRSKTGELSRSALRRYRFRNRNNTTIDLAHNYLATRQREPPGCHNEEEIVFFRDDTDGDEVASGISNSSHGYSGNFGDIRASRLLPVLLKHIHEGRLDESNGGSLMRSARSTLRAGEDSENPGGSTDDLLSDELKALDASTKRLSSEPIRSSFQTVEGVTRRTSNGGCEGEGRGGGHWTIELDEFHVASQQQFCEFSRKSRP